MSDRSPALSIAGTPIKDVLAELFAAARSPDEFFAAFDDFLVQLKHRDFQLDEARFGKAALVELYTETLHEVRSLLTAIVANLEGAQGLVRDIFIDDLDPAERALRIAELCECIDDAVVAADQSTQVATGSLSFHREISLRDCVARAVRLCRRTSDSYATIEIDDGHDVEVAAPAGEILQVLINLIRNAQQAVTHLPIRTITIRTWSSMSMAFASVSDNGPGFPPDATLERGRSEKEDGFGVGLHVCRRLVEKWGGTLTIESSDSGATVIFSIPLNNDSPQ